VARQSAIWSPEALGDVEAIWDYYSRIAGSATADALLRDIRRIVTLLEDSPLAGRARDEVQQGLRSFATHPHVVFYRVSGSGPQIVRILDGRRDIDESFSSPDEA